ncbi:MAG: AAA family ATPase [Cyclobacteriaceae bacterium]|nr:AAA family ATPase [Cyclobacteriaceae bacterium]
MSNHDNLTNSIRVDVVRICNFRSLKNIEIELGDHNLLVGMNNSGKTSFLKALHIALGADRRILSSDDFYIDQSGKEVERIMIDFRIVPVGEGRFSQIWIDNDFGSDIIAVDSDDQQFVAVRTIITRDVVKNDFVLERKKLVKWVAFADWQTIEHQGSAPHFDQLTSFFIDAQRDLVGDLRARSSYMGRLLAKIEMPDDELEKRLSELNDDIVSKSEVLSHVQQTLAGLNRTVPSFGDGVSINPVNKKMRDLLKGVGVSFADGDGASFPLESHGMGTRSWASLLSFDAYISWTGKLAEKEKLPFHPVLCLEEPEAHLHPNAQRLVYRQLCKGIGQRIVSTHSPYIAAQANLGEILHFRKIGGITQIQKIPVKKFEAEDIRKIQREVMRSRGELLFASAVVLFEGETEEQALPMFAERHWKQNPFERGVCFVGVGGDGNYAPFLGILAVLHIPCFIFSDGEPKACKRVSEAITKAAINKNDINVITLPNDKAIEGYLIDQGYQDELKLAFIESHKLFQNQQHEGNKKNEILAWTDEQLAKELKNNKTKMAVHWANAILALEGKRAIPEHIRLLLQRIDTRLPSNQEKVTS